MLVNWGRDMAKFNATVVKKCLENTIPNASKIKEPSFLPKIAGVEIAEIEYGFHGKRNKRTSYVIKGGIFNQPTYCKDRRELLSKLSEEPEERKNIFSSEYFPYMIISVLIASLLGFAIYFAVQHTNPANSSSIFQNVLNSIAGLIGVFIGLIGGKKL